MSSDNDIIKYKSKNLISQILIRSFQKSIVDVLLELDYQSLHEVGCGQGYNMKLLTSIKPVDCSGSDISEEALLLAKKNNPEVKFLRTSIYNLPFADNNFDLVVASEVLEHLDNPQNGLLEIKRITKKYCLLTVPNEPIWRILNILRGKYLKDYGNPSTHVNHWSKKTFINLVNQYFKIKKVKISLPWMIVLACK
ncbi:class I SAM-dependent methyltransferase [Patescibacteria group bacterium]